MGQTSFAVGLRLKSPGKLRRLKSRRAPRLETLQCPWFAMRLKSQATDHNQGARLVSLGSGALDAAQHIEERGGVGAALQQVLDV